MQSKIVLLAADAERPGSHHAKIFSRSEGRTMTGRRTEAGFVVAAIGGGRHESVTAVGSCAAGRRYDHLFDEC